MTTPPGAHAPARPHSGLDLRVFALRLGAASVTGALGWLSYFVPLGCLGAVPWIAACTVLAVRLPARYLGVVLLTSPMGAGAIGGVVSYASGAPVIYDAGFSERVASLDPATRARRRTPDGVLSFSEWMVHTPWNASVRAATFALGPAEGAYDGPYPSADEARFAAHQHGVVVPLDDIRDDRIVLGRRVFALVPGLGAALLEAVHRRPASSLSSRARPPLVHAVLVGDRALDLRFEGQPTSTRGPATDELVVLVDARRGLPFAYHPGAGAAVSVWSLPPVWSEFATYVAQPLPGGFEVTVDRRLDCTARGRTEDEALHVLRLDAPSCLGDRALVRLAAPISDASAER